MVYAPAMKFALHSANLVFPDPADAHRVVRAAEAAGFESAIAIEHLVSQGLKVLGP